MQNLRCVLFLTLALVTLTAFAGNQDQQDQVALRRALVSARDQWAATRPTTYEFVLSLPVGRGWTRRFASYRVTGEASVRLEPSDRTDPLYDGLTTIDSLFDFIDERLGKGPGHAFVEYDKALGFLRRLTFRDASFEVVAFRASPPGAVADPLVLVQHVNHCGWIADEPTSLGQCPSYAISVWGDGEVSYVGNFGVRTLGRRRHQVSADSVQQLVDGITAANFFALGVQYRGRVKPDGTQVIESHSTERWIVIRQNGHTKTVHDISYPPAALSRLEVLIEEIADSARYTGRR